MFCFPLPLLCRHICRDADLRIPLRLLIKSLAERFAGILCRDTLCICMKFTIMQIRYLAQLEMFCFVRGNDTELYRPLPAHRDTHANVLQLGTRAAFKRRTIKAHTYHLHKQSVCGFVCACVHKPDF